ncbi:hypothetical protein A6A04_08385 [Paramagnetospirillum marisnigri]|uniref:Pilus formation protein N-terminal domain-containing protein n=1 Tax=Paramagnetospirillum marisnigri TaxID=1285242 RepID=A0A178M7R0_9PROT|nr:pilus assembly protein N-terminal domain-containing protein [Paramagnetospirillum marisnigri]OAN44821.1 hypothetical protein A6A04_08385 [Paramagnetospirillum marisnigri]
MTRPGLSTLLVVAALASAPALAAESVEVALGGATQLKLSAAARQVIIGNPAIADVTMQNARSLTLFGKYPGGTSLSVLDGAGRVVLDAVVVVTAGGAESVTVRYGTGKTWVPGGVTTVVDCSPQRCAPAVSLPSESPYKAGAAAPAPAPAAK